MSIDHRKLEARKIIDISNLEGTESKDQIRRRQVKDKIHSICESKGITFQDPNFGPSSRSSMHSSKDWRLEDSRELEEKVDWVPAEQLKAAKCTFLQEIVPGDVRQGALRNRYLISCLNVLAEKPGLVKKLASQEQHGLISIWLFINGAWTELLLDELLPVFKTEDGVSPAFAHTKSGDLWPNFFEKAYAKAYNSYAAIEGGSTTYTIRELTGAPYTVFTQFKDLNSFWEKVKAALERDWILMCSCSTDEYKNEGLEADQVYPIIDLQEIISSFGKFTRLVKLRDHSKSFSWTGRWSALSEEWTEASRKKFKVDEEREDVIWMNLEDLASIFDVVNISMVEPDFHSSSCIVEHLHSNKSILYFKLKEDSDVNVSLDQLDLRTCVSNPQYRFSYFRMTIAKISDSGFQYVESKISCQKNIFISDELPKGEYCVLVEAYWESTTTDKRFAVGTYSSTETQVIHTTSNDTFFKQVEYQIWVNFALNNRASFDKKSTKTVSDGLFESKYEM
jgi:hypothetical protein